MYIQRGSFFERGSKIMNTETPQRGGALGLKLCWGVGALWLIAFVVGTFQSGTPIGQAGVGLSALMLLAFVVVHGSLAYGWRGFAVYCALGLIAGFGYE